MIRRILRQALQRLVHFEQQGALAIVPYQALRPEEGCQTHATGNGLDPVQAGGRIEHQIPRRELHLTSKLKVGGGAFYVDEVFGNLDNTTKVDSYVPYDAMVSYEVNSNLDLQLNVQNLTDEVYYDNAYGTHFANQAAGRTVLLSTNVHF